MKKVLVIYCNPDKKSFGTSLGKFYVKGLKKNKNNVKELHLNDLKFNLKSSGLNLKQPLEKDLVKAQEMILWAEHIVFCYPIWWYNFPSVLKGFFDRVLLSGFAFKYIERNPIPKGLLKGRTALALVTMDAPVSFYRYFIGSPDKKILKNVLSFCGIKLKRIEYFGSVRKSSHITKNKWLAQAEYLGMKFK